MAATTVSDGEFEVSSNSETEAQIRTSLDVAAPAPEVVVEADPAPVPVAEAKPAADETSERNADGTFKKRAPRNDPQARIDQAIARQRETERENATLKAELARRNTPPPAASPPVEAKPTVAEWKRFQQMPDAPKLDQFETIEDYNFAVGVFIQDKRDAQRTEATQRQQQADESRTLDQGWYGRLAEARAKDPDSIASINPETPLSAPMMHAIKESPVGVALLRHLSDHQELAQRLSTLHPAQAMREMGRLEAQLEAAPSPAASAPVVPPVSQAKPPAKPLGTAPLVSDEPPDPDDADLDKHLRYYDGKDRAARRR